ncbi:hypothetical protein CC80DRAFT_580413 [Byssothecium circinans]|uniref:Uncharacterized protein n=1 Tax=Byssothecium circinans TaxID=147558 RepID=A0A6A5U747_9PLEO|nr:hypothetical protein CC80DRAFT_580413 [Byssothecium circinans]
MAWAIQLYSNTAYALLHSMVESGELSSNVSLAHVQRAIYFGRVRYNRRVDQRFSDEPCLYIVLPHMPTDIEIDFVAERLLEDIIVSSFKEAMNEYKSPSVPGGAKRPTPLFTNKQKASEEPSEYRVYTHLFESWDANNNVEGTENPSIERARREIHRLAWRYMEEKADSISKMEHGSVFQDMILLVVVPRIEYTVTSTIGPRYIEGADPAFAAKEAMDLYSNDLDGNFLGPVRVAFQSEFGLKKGSEVRVGQTGRPSIKTFFERS